MKMFLLGALFASSLFVAVHAQQATQTQRIPLFENDDVKRLEVRHFFQTHPSPCTAMNIRA